MARKRKKQTPEEYAAARAEWQRIRQMLQERIDYHTARIAEQEAREARGGLVTRLRRRLAA
jgi:hypothetical protein